MIARRDVLALMSWAIPGWAVAQRGETSHVSASVPLDDPHIKVVENVWIPMADGARLAARLFLPASAETRPAGAVLEYLPSRKRDGYRYRDDVAGAFLAKGGIALVRVDIRGSGDSDGSMVDEYSPVEQADASRCSSGSHTSPGAMARSACGASPTAHSPHCRRRPRRPPP